MRDPARVDVREHAELDSVLDDWRRWAMPLRGRPRVRSVVQGGRTNRNVRLDAPGLDHDLLLRLNHPEPARLGIDRSLERAILEVVADAGVGRPALHWDAAGRYALFPWVEGRSWTSDDFADPEQRARLSSLLARVEPVELDRPRRRYHAYLDHYRQQLKQAGGIDAELEAAWRAFEPGLLAFDRAPWPARLVHHDLIPANVLDHGDGLVLIDWEYAAPGHADIDRWSIDPAGVSDPFIGELMGWVNGLWERLMSGAASGR